MEKNRKKYHRGRRKKKKGSVISLLIMIIACAVLLISSIRFLLIQKEYKDGESEYEKIHQLVINTKDEEGFSVDFDELKKLNEDVVGWIRFEEPAIINYPVVQGKDNSEYLSITFSGYDNTVGSIFMDARNQGDFTDQHTLIYGHRMNNGTMFNELDNYKEETYGEEHPYFYIYTPDGIERKFQIYSTAIVSEVSDVYACSFANEEEYTSFIKESMRGAFYNANVKVTADDQIVTLSTCTGDRKDERLVVHGVLIEEKKQGE